MMEKRRKWKNEEGIKWKNKHLMGIIGLIAAAVIGTLIYSATAGKDNRRQAAMKRLKLGSYSWSAAFNDLIYKEFKDGLAEERLW